MGETDPRPGDPVAGAGRPEAVEDGLRTAAVVRNEAGQAAPQHPAGPPAAGAGTGRGYPPRDPGVGVVGAEPAGPLARIVAAVMVVLAVVAVAIAAG